jgi:hypothetical protein
MFNKTLTNEIEMNDIDGEDSGNGQKEEGEQIENNNDAPFSTKSAFINNNNINDEEEEAKEAQSIDEHDGGQEILPVLHIHKEEVNVFKINYSKFTIKIQNKIISR